MNDIPTDQAPDADPGIGATSASPAIATLTPLGQQYLDQTRPWARFMSVMTFVSAGFLALIGFVMLLVGIFGGLAARETGALGPLGGAIGMGLMAVLYLAMACVYIAPGMFLWRYASAIQGLKVSATTGLLEEALKQQRSFWRYVGILTVIVVVVVVMVIGLAGLMGVMAALMAARS